jgi:hypothetical protein
MATDISGMKDSLATDVSSMKVSMATDISGMKESISGLKVSIAAAKVWALVLYFALAAGIFGTLARAFGWI